MPPSSLKQHSSPWCHWILALRNQSRWEEPVDQAYLCLERAHKQCKEDTFGTATVFLCSILETPMKEGLLSIYCFFFNY